MGYGAVGQHDRDSQDGGDSDDSASPPLRTPSLGLFLDHHNTSSQVHSARQTGRGLDAMVQSITSESSRGNQSYDTLEEDDFEAIAKVSPELPVKKHRRSSPSEDVSVPLHIPRPQRRRDQTTTADSTLLRSRDPISRTASGRSIALRHPTPDLQVLAGAYTGNIEHLEKTAERLSMTSSIEDAIRELHDEQKRSDSRRSSLLSSPGMAAISRQVSNASSIVEVNSAARSGGYSPAGYLLSPKGSFTNGNGRGRSASRGSRFSRPEPEMEGRPLDSFVNMQSVQSPISPSFSIPQQDEDTSTLTRAINLIGTDGLEAPMQNEEDRPVTSASEQLEKMFADFDGTHSETLQHTRQTRSVSGISGGNLSNDSEHAQRRVSSGNRMSMAMLAPRPQSYMDPSTNQQMVYYPAPVPMMLNLPQKLSKNPSSQARNKRRSQVLSTIPPAARQSAIWLPDVLEHGEDEPDEDDEAQRQEYIPQHQRASMGGRRLTQDLSHMPPQLRASTYFDLPGPDATVELKEQSAVATLDSILDASAHAPVSAFTDHAFAGALGAEVYGRSHVRNSRSTTQLLESQTAKKRSSSFNLLRGRRSHSDLLDSDKRKSTMSALTQSVIRSPIEDDDEDDTNNKDTTPLQQSEAGHSRNGSGEFAVKPPGDEESDDGQFDDEIFHGPPTTLLAELQLRKQRQKQRTQPITKTFPNGIHSTLLEMDTVIQTEQKHRKKGRTVLAWEDPMVHQAEAAAAEDDDDVPLALLFSKKAEENRPLGLMERRDLEDNEPLSRRRDRLQGKPPMPRASTMMHLSGPPDPAAEEGETLAQTVRRLEATVIPEARPVSGDFATEMMSQFGGDVLSPDVKGKGKATEPTPSPGPEEEETLGQRRKRLQAEREARALEVGNPSQPQRPEAKSRRSMADILQAHPSAGADRIANYQKPAGGLLGMHDKQARRASTMLNFDTSHVPGGQRKSSGGFKAGLYNDGQGGIIPSAQPVQAHIPRQSAYNPQLSSGLFPQPSIGVGNNMWANQYPMPMNTNMNMGGLGNGAAMYDPNQFQYQMGLMQNQMGMMMGQSGGMEPLNQGQIDMVERWRQSVMQ